MPESQLSITQVAVLWNCSRGHIYNLISTGKLRSTDIGIRDAKTRVPESAVDEFIRKHGRIVPRRNADDHANG